MALAGRPAARRIASRWLACLGLLLALAWQASPAQINPDDLLPVEEAFALSASVDGAEVVLDWRIADGYYLYRHAFRVDRLGDGLEAG